MFRKIMDLFRNKKVHDIKSGYTADMIAIQVKGRKQMKYSKEMLEAIKSSRGYKIAMATGGRNRGL